MADRQAQEFWDQMWYWERFEQFPSEQLDDPHLVIVLGGQVDAALNAGEQPDPELLRRFDACTGRVLNRLTNLIPRSGDAVDFFELKHWLKFGLDPNNRGHGGTSTPIIDANSLIIFLRFATYAQAYCSQHNLDELGATWNQVHELAQEVEDEHIRDDAQPVRSRFEQ